MRPGGVDADRRRRGAHEVWSSTSTRSSRRPRRAVPASRARSSQRSRRTTRLNGRCSIASSSCSSMTPRRGRVSCGRSPPICSQRRRMPRSRGSRPRLGGECDLVAVDADGRLLAVEVKPRGAADIPWAPLQVIVYGRLLRRWMRNDPAGAGILNGIAVQRRALGLLTDEGPTIAADAAVVPFLAIQRGMKPVYRERLAAISRAPPRERHPRGRRPRDLRGVACGSADASAVRARAATSIAYTPSEIRHFSGWANRIPPQPRQTRD